MTFIPPNPGKYYYSFSDIVLYPENETLYPVVENSLLTLQKLDL